MTKYIIFGSPDDYLVYFLQDITSRNDVLFLSGEKKIQNIFKYISVRLLCRIGKLFPRIEFLLRVFHMWLFKFLTDNAKIDKNDDNVFIFFDANRMAYNGAFLTYLKKCLHGKTVVLFYNPINKTPFINGKYRKYYDLLGSFNKVRAEKYHCTYIPGFYSAISVEADYNDISDIFFVGRAKEGRIDLIHRFFAAAKKNGVKCNFYIIDVDVKNMLFPEEIHYNQELPYIEVVKKLKASKCILEVVQSGVEGGTLRTSESMYYNKFLISNNKALSDVKGYDGRFMKYLGDVDTFDFSFLREPIKVEYPEQDKSANKTLEAIRKELNLQ